MDNLEKNYGVPQEQVREGDWKATGETGIIPVVAKENGDWTDMLPDPERQSDAYMDSDACVSYSALHALEEWLNFLLSQHLFDGEELSFFMSNGYIVNGKFELSARFTAKVSGTTTNGNSMGQVWDSIRHIGFVPKSAWEFTPDMTWNQFYADVPTTLLDLARKTTEILDVKYEWVVDGVPNNQAIIDGLKVGPIQIVVHLCNGWTTSKTISACGNLPLQHGVNVYAHNDEVFNILDDYQPFLKELAGDYCIPYALRPVVSIKRLMTPTANETIAYEWLTDLKIGSTGADVIALQQALTIQGFFKLAPTGYFGTWTEKAVMAFQEKYADQILTPANLTAPTGYFGELTRSVMNGLYGGQVGN